MHACEVLGVVCQAAGCVSASGSCVDQDGSRSQADGSLRLRAGSIQWGLQPSRRADDPHPQGIGTIRPGSSCLLDGSSIRDANCRVLVNGGRVEFVTDEGRRSLYWNIPIANTTTVLLGTGTSLTQAAMRELAKAGVLVGFCGGGGTPLFAANEIDVEVAWLSPQSEYRPTEYLQWWVKFWFDDRLRLEAAKAFQRARLDRIRRQWLESRTLKEAAFEIDNRVLSAAIDDSLRRIDAVPDNPGLLAEEARLSKELYKLAARAVSYGDFVGAKRGSGADPANRFLDHGNYLAYGLAATATWVIGLPHGLAVLHGKTRRGGLVFDVADLVKDATILPQALSRCVCFRRRIVRCSDRRLSMTARASATQRYRSIRSRCA